MSRKRRFKNIGYFSSTAEWKEVNLNSKGSLVGISEHITLTRRVSRYAIKEGVIEAINIHLHRPSHSFADKYNNDFKEFQFE